MTTTLFTLFLLASFAGSAKAASLATLHRREHRQLATLSRDRGTLRFFANHRWLLHRPLTRPVALHALRFARAEISWTVRELAQTRAALRPRVLVGHMAGWLCIHAGEGDGWNPSHSYSGPLQMTPYWSGYPVYDWDTVPMAQVFADADTVAREHGYSYGWMAGQWPNTFPRCAGYFA
jgi:hypothetical protein